MKTSVRMNILHVKFRLLVCRWKNRLALWHYCYVVYPRCMAAIWLNQPLRRSHSGPSNSMAR
jgi:hypothetical protein